jgi:flagellum-specific ATP synthase
MWSAPATAARRQGSITAIYTVLVEGDDHVGDPVADTARSVLDGHIVLSARSPKPRFIRRSTSSPRSPGRCRAWSARPNITVLASQIPRLWAGARKSRTSSISAPMRPGRDLLLDEAFRRAPGDGGRDPPGHTSFRAPACRSYAALQAAMAETAP